MKKNVELRLVDLKTIDLAMLKRITTDDLVRGKKGFRVAAQPRIRRKGPMFRDPCADRAFGYLYMEAPAKNGLRFGNGITFVECGHGLKDGLQRVALVLAGVSEGKPMLALAALVHLERTHAIAALALSDGIRTVALRTWRALFRVPELTRVGRRCGRGLNCCGCS